MDHELPRPALPPVVVTQLLLGALFLFGIGAITLLPQFSASATTELPEYAALRAPLLTLAIAFTGSVLVLVAIVAVLVLRIHRGTVLARSSLRWVDAMVIMFACAVVLVVIGFVVISNGQAGSPFLALIQALTCPALTALACITLVLRSLLRHAVLIRTELEEVV